MNASHLKPAEALAMVQESVSLLRTIAERSTKVAALHERQLFEVVLRRIRDDSLTMSEMRVMAEAALMALDIDLPREIEIKPGDVKDGAASADTKRSPRIIGVCDFWLKNVQLLGAAVSHFGVGTVGDMHVTETDVHGEVVHASFYPGGDGAGSGFGSVIRPQWKFFTAPPSDTSEDKRTSDMIDVVDAEKQPGGRFIIEFLANLIGRDGQKVLPPGGRTNVHVDIRVNSVPVSFTEFYDGFIQYYTENVKNGVREHMEQRCGDIADRLSRLEREMTHAALDRLTTADDSRPDDPDLLVEVGHPGHEQVRADTPEGRGLLNPGCRLVWYVPAHRAWRQP